MIPFRGDGKHRDQNLEWVKARYEAHFPLWEVVVGRCHGEPWVKADAVMPAVRTAPSDVVVIADADVWTNGLGSAVRAVTAGVAEWAIPHKTVHRFNEDASEAIIAGELPVLRNTERRPYEGVPGGGIVVAHRDTFLRIPLDSRFEGPGQEDEAWGVALWTLAGPPWRGTADLIHLHHPPLPRLSHRRGSKESWDLFRRYQMARRDPEAMKSLIEEFNDPSQPDESSGDDRSSLSLRAD